MTHERITPKLLEILASRISHDLIGPISAVNNGVEFWQEMGSDAGDDAINLIGHSAKQASYKLQLFRLAYGSGGSESHVKLDDLEKSFANFVSETRVDLKWELPAKAYEGEMPRGFCKIVLHLMMASIDFLPKGGEIEVSETGPKELRIKTISENFQKNEDFLKALEGKLDSEDVTPRSIHPYLTKIYADTYDVSFDITASENDVSFKISF